jgi:hypothetical protein
MTTFRKKPWTLEVKQDVSYVETMGGDEPDPNWRYVDEAGHEHTYAATGDHYPTLREVIGPSYWCDTCRDEHEDYEATYRECVQCGERITPATIFRGPHRFPVRGIRSATLTSDEGDSCRMWYLTDDEWNLPPLDTFASRCEAFAATREPDARSWKGTFGGVFA